MNRFAKSVLVVLLVFVATLGIAGAQGRGRVGSAGAGTAIRGGTSFSNARGATLPAQRGGGMGPVATPPIATPPVSRPPVVTPPIATPRPPLNWKNPGPTPPYYGNRRQVVIGSPYPDYYYGSYYPYYSPYPYLTSEPYYPYPAESQNATDLADQVERLTKEVEQLRQDQANLLSQLSTSSPPRRAPEVPAAPIALVFRDGHRVSIQNYAIVRGSLWVLDEFMSTRIQLSDLDLEATRQANPGRTLLLPVEQGR